MLKLEKIDFERTEGIRLFKKNGKILELGFYKNDDLCFNLIYSGDEQIFTIRKEDKKIYDIFEKTYNRIANCEIYTIKDLQLYWLKKNCEKNGLNYESEYFKLEEEIKKQNNILKESETYKKIYTENLITWKSDKDESLFEFIKYENKYVLKFQPSENNKIFSDYYISVVIKNKDSKSKPFNLIFMDLYKDLIKENDDCVFNYLQNNEIEKQLIKKI